MKTIVLFCSILLLTSCGTIGIGSNHTVNIHNNSNSAITANGSYGTIKIDPKSAFAIESANDIKITSTDKKCANTEIIRIPNTPALILDVIPGFLFGIIPILVDAVSNNLYKMPSNYYYQCD